MIPTTRTRQSRERHRRQAAASLKALVLASPDPRAEDQISSSLRLSASIAFSDASRNVAENVPRLILFAMLVPRDHCLSHWQAKWRCDGPIRSRLAWPGDRCAGNFDGRLLAVSARHPGCVPEQRPWCHQQDVQRYALGSHGPGAPPLFAGSRDRGCEGSGAWRAGRNQHVLCGAQQSFDPHGEPALYPADKCFQQEVGQSPFGGCAVRRALQSVPGSRVAFAECSQSDNARDGAWANRPRVVTWRVDRCCVSCCDARSDRNGPGAASQVSRDRRWPQLIKTIPGVSAGYRQSTCHDGRAARVLIVTGRHWHVRPCLHVKSRSHPGPEQTGNESKHAPIVRNATGYTRSQRQTLVCCHGYQPWLAPFCFAGSHPAMASGRRGPAMQQKGIASDGRFYRSVLSERTKCPKFSGVRTAPELDGVDHHLARRSGVVTGKRAGQIAQRDGLEAQRPVQCNHLDLLGLFHDWLLRRRLPVPRLPRTFFAYAPSCRSPVPACHECGSAS